MQDLEEETQMVASARAGTKFQVVVAQQSTDCNFMNILKLEKLQVSNKVIFEN